MAGRKRHDMAGKESLKKSVEAAVDGRAISAPPAPDELTREAVMACLLALRMPNGYGQYGGYVATRLGEFEVELSVPNEHGGHWRYRLRLPERLPVQAA
ncbi:MAG TPA: hypothetical protein VGS41_12700 [Chthonomonadales bacterium]|nr:hypothetical protein [Chthonomonadales bacterium]